MPSVRIIITYITLIEAYKREKREERKKKIGKRNNEKRWRKKNRTFNEQFI